MIISIGELEENLIGSNSGQYITRYKEAVASGYTYPLRQISNIGY